MARLVKGRVAELSTWLKQTGGAIFAALVLCLSLVPTLDSMVCSTDTQTVESVLTKAGDQVVEAAHDHGGKGHREAGGDACIHGHCHQSVSPAAAVNAQLAVAHVSDANLTPAETGVLPSRAPEGLMEPPRA